MADQKKKGHSEESAKKICGTIEKKTQESKKGSEQENDRVAQQKVLSREDNGRMFLDIFLLDGSVNKNDWGLDGTAIPAHINSVIGKPVVMFKNALGQFDHPSLEDRDLEHALAYQDLFAIGKYIDVRESKTHPGQWWGIAEVTDDKVKQAIRDDPEVPFFVSPTIRLLNSYQNEQSIRDWEFMHSALVDRPAFGVHKSFIGGSCNGDQNTCLLQLRKASIEENGYGCGFCTYDATHQLQDKILLNLEGVTRGQRPDSDFAYVPDSAKGADGKKSDRKFPIYDCAHVRNAAARFNQAQLPSGAKSRVKGKICGAAKRCKIESEFCSSKQGAVAILFDDNGNELPDESVFSSQQGSTSNAPSILDNNTESNTDTAAPKETVVPQVVEQKAEPTQQVQEKTAKELLDTIQSLTTRNKELELQIQSASADKSSYETILKKLSTEVEELKSAREVEQKAARVNTITEIVNRSALYAGLPSDEKQRQIDNFVTGSMSLDQIKGMILPLEANFRKASLIPNSYQNARLPLGKQDTVETRTASVKDDIPAWLRLPAAMFKESPVTGGDMA